MTFYVLIPLIAAFTNLLLGVGVLVSDIRNSLRRVFVLFCFCVSLWNLGCAVMYYLPEDKAFLGVKLLAPAIFFIPPTFFHFVISYTKIKRLQNICILGYIFSFGLLIADNFKLIHTGVKAYDFGNYPQLGFISPLYLIEFVVLMGYGIYLLIKRYTDETSITVRNQIRYLFIGIILVVVSSSTNFAPFLGIELYPLGHLGAIFYNLIIAYAIIKYRLLDINVFVQKCVLYFILFALLFVFCLLITPVIMSIVGEQIKMNYVFTASLIVVITFLPGYWFLMRVRKWTGQQLLTKGKKQISMIEQLGNLIISATGQDADTLIRKTIKELSEILKVSGGYMFLREAGDEKYDMVYTTGGSCDSEKSASIPGNSPLIDILSAQRGTIVKEELELKADHGSYGQSEREKLLAAAEQLADFGIAVCIPLITSNGTIGLLNLGKKKSDKLFSLEELNKLTKLGNEIAIALENARLVEELRNRAKEQETLSQIASEMMSMYSSRDLGRQIFIHIGNIIVYNRCLYLRWTDEAESLVLEYAEGFDESAEELLKQIPIEVEQYDKSGDVLDAEQVAKMLENYLDEKEVKQSGEFSLSIPIFMERKLYGVFCVFRWQVAFSEEQERLLRIVGSQIVALHERMASTLAQAETVAMMRALRQIAHDMSHAFGILSGSLELLQESLSEMSETDQSVTSLIKSKVEHLDRAIGELKRLTDEEKIRLRQEDVNAALNSALQLVASRLSTSNIEVVTQDLQQAGAMFVLIPAGQLTRVFFNLLLNAIEAMPQGGVLKLTTKLKTRKEAIIAAKKMKARPGDRACPVSSSFSAKEVPNGAGEIAEITISDTGCGIADEELDKIFKLGFTTKASSGLGLAEVKRIINTCGGKIEVHSQLGVGTNFVIQLPCHRHLYGALSSTAR